MFKEKVDFALGVSLVFESKTLHNLYRINGLNSCKADCKTTRTTNNSKIPIKKHCLKTRAPKNDQAKQLFETDSRLHFSVLRKLLSGGRQKEVSNHYDTATGTS